MNTYTLAIVIYWLGFINGEMGSWINGLVGTLAIIFIWATGFDKKIFEWLRN